MLEAIAYPALASPAPSENVIESSPQIDYRGFAVLTLEVADLRRQRHLSREDFFARAAAGDAVLLDTRSAAAFQMGHV